LKGRMSIMDGDLGDQIIASSVSDVTFASELDGLAARLSENGGSSISSTI